MSPSQKMKKLVVVDDGISTIKVDGLEPYARTLADEFVIHRDAPADNEALIQRCQGADAVINILSTSEFTRDLMTRCPDLRVVSIWAAGVNNVDLDAAQELGVTICNTPGYGNFGVGEHTLALMLAAARNMHQVDRRIRQGEWVKEPLVQLYGKTLGVLGAGPIAQRVMELGRLIGMDVIAWTLNPSPERAAKYGVEFVDVDTLCQKADVVAAIIALSDKTHHVIGRKQLGDDEAERHCREHRQGRPHRRRRSIRVPARRQDKGRGPRRLLHRAPPRQAPLHRARQRHPLVPRRRPHPRDHPGRRQNVPRQHRHLHRRQHPKRLLPRLQVESPLP